MLVAFPYCPKDQEQAERWAEWVLELGGCKGHEILVVQDTRVTNAGRVQMLLAQSFDKIEVLPFVDLYSRWPDAPNAVLSTAARHIEATNPRPWFFCEPDCIPMRQGWLDIWEREYKASGKPFMGDRVEVNDVPLHMSGNGSYPGEMMANAGLALIAGDIAWDVAAATQIVPRMHETKLLEHSWLHPSFTSWEQVQREIAPETIIYHASKDGSLIALLRERRNNLSGGVEKSRETRWQAGKDRPEATPSENDGSPMRRVSGSEISPRQSCGSSVPPAQNLTCDILIKSYPPDYEWLGYCLRSIEKFARGFRRVIVVAPGALPAGLSRMKNIAIVQVPEQGDGYLWQQAIKASADEFTDADYILHIDSDVILTKSVTPESFFQNGKPAWFMSPYDKIEVPWKPITEKFLGEPVEFEFMRRFPILIPRSVHMEASSFCLLKHRMRLTDYILQQPNREFSEFNILGALAHSRAHDDFSWINTHAA